MTKEEMDVMNRNFDKYGIAFMFKKGINDWDCVICPNPETPNMFMESYKRADIDKYLKIVEGK